MPANKSNLVEKQTAWPDFALLMLGLWLLATSLTFGGSFEMSVNDAVSGVVLIFLSFFSFRSPKLWLKWSFCLVGIWLQFSPLLFWAKYPFNYLNDTLVGVFVIGLSILIPGEVIEKTHTSSSIPEGWSYNPSAWPQRFPIAFLAFFSWMFARYMAVYQLGYIHDVWDPVFGNGTEKVITSSISHDFPVSDAGLGALAYTMETLMALHGSPRRWHTMPWFVILFAIVVIPLGIASITLIILQPILVRFWCFWCLLTAVCMLLMVSLAVDEAAAVIQYLNQQMKQGNSFWEIIWKGGEAPAIQKKFVSSNRNISRNFFFWAKGISFPWNLTVSAILGGWFMFCSSFFQISQIIADQEHIIGAFMITISIISMAEIVRAGRFLLAILGIWALADIWFLSGFALLNHLAIGTGAVLLSIPRGKIKEKYGPLQSYIF